MQNYQQLRMSIFKNLKRLSANEPEAMLTLSELFGVLSPVPNGILVLFPQF